MTARTATPPEVAAALVDAQLVALESSLKAYRRRVMLAHTNPRDDRGIRGLERVLVVAAALERTAVRLIQIERETIAP